MVIVCLNVLQSIIDIFTIISKYFTSYWDTVRSINYRLRYNKVGFCNHEKRIRATLDFEIIRSRSKKCIYLICFTSKKVFPEKESIDTLDWKFSAKIST